MRKSRRGVLEGSETRHCTGNAQQACHVPKMRQDEVVGKGTPRHHDTHVRNPPPSLRGLTVKEI